ncbi:hypothetical protein GCM10010082_20060 [Kushneria pakistanensis]|uniref:Uncharacterized protein n=1 Tax=Kushneria pakistanensis TaxID=1508770 RepID=A0ABQ3FJS6_9GAMM|nr:hypothetical protein [Kushneria pakistanensis]GHC26791.1 hypothetical protein GCM10010082_20060 [Kushneria pakistanensis]
MALDQLTPAQLSRLEGWLQRQPGIDGLAALLLERLEANEAAGRAHLDSGRLSRELGVAHALVRRTASELEARGLVTITSRSGAGPGLWLALIPG